jgi:DNA-binding transcriptional MerR regulator
MRKKTPTKLYYSITEVAELTGVKPHVLRYWETEFKTLRPKKNRAGNRTYRTGDIKVIQAIKKLLYDDGFTIAGAKKKILESKSSPGRSRKDRKTAVLEQLRKDLEEMRRLLDE